MSPMSSCAYDCPDCCSLIVEQEGADVRISGNPDHPVTRGMICPKGRNQARRLASRERVTRPMLRQGNGFTPIGWDQALALCAERLDALRHEPTSVLHAKGHGYRGLLANASKYLFRAFGATGLKGSLCDETGCEACLRDFGELGANDPDDLAHSGCIVNWGRDLSRTSLHLMDRVNRLRKQGTPSIAISPGGDDWTRYADEHILIRPGTDRFLALAVLSMVLDKKAPSRRLLESSRDADDFLALMRAQDVDRLLHSCQVSYAQGARLAEVYASEKPTASLLGWGLQRHVHGGENVRFINALAFLSGNIGRSGGGSAFNFSSSRNFHPWHHQGGEYGRKLWLQDLPNELAGANPPIRMAWIDGLNLVNQVPDARAMARAFEAIDFTVAVDGFMTDTAMRADLVLPCALLLEREDVLGSFAHNVVNYLRPCLEPPGEAREDFDIATDLGARLADPIELPDREHVFLTGIRDEYLVGGISGLRQYGFVRAKRSTVAFQDLRFGHEDGLYHFPSTLSPEPDAPEGYPFRLLTLISRGHIHSQILEEEQAGPVDAYVCPDNPLLGDAPSEAEPGVPARLETSIGRLDVRLRPLPGLHPEVVAVRRGGWLKLGRSANAIIPCIMTDMGGGTAYYSTWASIART